MTFRVSTFTPTGDAPATQPLLLLEAGSSQATVVPAIGFNCIRWQAAHGGQLLDLLYAAPTFFADGRPTRSGIPILFPFPNRIRDGQFVWDGRRYQLPGNDASARNAIHGFACRRPWRVVGEGSAADHAWATGEFHGRLDAADVADLWPADYRLRVTYRLGRDFLGIDAEVHNPDTKPLPFGLGYHPYFKLPFAGEAKADGCAVCVPASSYWELDDNALPKGDRRPVDAGRDLNRPRPYGELHLDDVLTDLPAGRRERGWVEGLPGVRLRVLCDPAFRELVVFTPQHREAFCVEPYTCATDAVNLEARGVPAGWVTLAPGATWAATVELRLTHEA